MIKNCTFGEALECIKQGGVASREGWNGKGQYISLGVNITYQNFYGATITADHALKSDHFPRHKRRSGRVACKPVRHAF